MPEGEDFEKVIWAIEDKFYDEGLLSKRADIVERSGLSKSIVSEVLDMLIGSNEIDVIYESPGDPVIYITKEMKNALTSQSSEPDWITEYEFDEKRELIDKVSDVNDRISEIQRIERLLYGTGEALEDSVEYALDFLGFDFDTTDEYEDVFVEYDDHIYIIEIKGVENNISKSNAEQLGSWIDRHLDMGVSFDDMTGLLIYNHELHTDPALREDGLTDKAVETLKFNSSDTLQTQTLFDLVKSVDSNEIEKDEARRMVLEGD